MHGLLLPLAVAAAVGLVGAPRWRSGEDERTFKCPQCPRFHDAHLPAPDHAVLLAKRPGTAAPPLPLPYAAEAPVAGVDVSSNALLLPAMEANIEYLLTSFDVNHMLLPFRLRAGLPAPNGSRPQVPTWDTDLRGSNAGRFLMGAGNTLRWVQNQTLRTMLDNVIDGIDACKNQSTGYMLPFDPPGFMHSEQGDYARSWLTQGLIEAAKAGNHKARPLLRGMYDWFNDETTNPYLPYLYDGVSNGEQGQIASTRVYLESGVGVWADSQVAQDTYRDELWMRQLIARDPTGISDYHMPQPNHPHCYEITAFLSIFDNYRATHNRTWLNAAQGAWDIIDANFIHIDGSSSLTEGRPDPAGGDYRAKSYRLAPSVHTGETCCTTFWLKFNQRFGAEHVVLTNNHVYRSASRLELQLRENRLCPLSGEQLHRADGSVKRDICV
jgi:hypothetical protein